MKRKDFSNIKIEVKNEKDSYFEHEDYIAGVSPNLRGIHSTMYFQTPLETKISTDTLTKENTTPEIELSTFLAESLSHIRKNIEANYTIDTIAPQLTFETKIGKNHFDEIAKMRAARMLWSKLIKQFNPKNQRSFALTINATVDAPFDAFQAILGGCQSIISKDKDYLFFEEEIEILKTIDPWAGSTYVEKITEKIANKSWFLFKKTTI
ncbi:methylmalonyl-CoA mutase family protein [Lutibacter flavus]|uniref:Methylmalonyl-CoA mutase n=1 Tax=Lutibacter flavus TaxID=691689 RepID=A0A238Z1D2_9FLAO|nr:methylmalonyl-CoA mutase family protein [Lutibacter flavus]SNR77245.1 Methylmalonyl-CoA mutase [Lutibacter flavus]